MRSAAVGGQQRGFGLGARLAALSLLTLLSTLAAGGVAVLTVQDVRDAQLRHTRTNELAAQAVQLDELNESLRGDVLARYSSLVVGTTEVSEDVQQLQRVSVELQSGRDGAELQVLGHDEYQYAAGAQALLSSEKLPRRAAMEAFNALSGALADRVDRQRQLLEQHAVDSTRALDESIRAAILRMVELSGGAAGVLFVLGLWIRRGLLASLARLAEVARAVADGNLAARTGSHRGDEVGQLAQVLDEMAEALQSAFTELDTEASRQEFRTRLDRALAYVDDDQALSGTVGQALAVTAPSLPVELLVADSSEAHLHRFAENASAGAPGCEVSSPWSCPAVRGGRPTVFPSSNQIDACPHLRGRPQGERSGACMPVSFMGRMIGVLHAAGAPDQLPDHEGLARLETLAEQIGSRLGALRALQKVQLQASLDGLTGLPNRRTFEDSVQQLEVNGRRYGLLMADLDRFKTVNDTYGHAAGDRALRVFADVLRIGLRAEDLPCRYGGEEFAIALPGMDAREAAAVGDRLRQLLVDTVGGGEGPAFTVSLGVADSTMAGTLSDQLIIADEALLTAKRGGRDQVVIGSPTGRTLPRPRHLPRLVEDGRV